MKKLNSVAAAAFALAMGGSANAANLVVNGDFSQNGGNGQIGYNTSATGWYVPNGGYTFLFANGTADTTGASGQYGLLALWGSNSGGLNAIATPPSGAGYFAAVDGDFQNQPLNQDLTGLTVGQKYAVTFDYAYAQQSGFYGDTQQKFDVSLGGATQSTPIGTNPSQGFTGWSTDTMIFKATSANETLSFAAYGSLPVPPFALVTGVSMTAVPEPATWAMMLLGFGGLAFAGRRRSRPVTVEA